MTLVTIRPGVSFQQPAAESFQRVEAALGRRADVNRTTDSWDTQMQKYREYLAYLAGGPWAPLALHPSKGKHVYRDGDPSSATAWDTDERGPLLDEHGWIADVDGEPWHREYRWWLDKHRNEGAPAGETSQPFEEALIVNDNDKAWLNAMGQSIVDQINGGPIRADLNTVHNAVKAVRADINYIHQLSPYSLKAILEAERNGEVTLTEEQASAIAGQLTATAIEGIDAALKDDFDGLKALIAKQPPEFVAALKAAL